MLKNIEIHNFRGFERTKISGFERVNLIAGRNNSGKTALLEALFLNDFSQAQSVATLKSLRRESSEITKAMPNKAWDSLFFNQNRKEKIEIIGTGNDGTVKRIEIWVDESISKETFEQTEETETLLNLLSSNLSVLSILNFQVTVDRNEPVTSSVISSSRGLIAKGMSETAGIPFIPSCLRTKSKDLKDAYDKARLEYKDREVLKAFQILDASIETVDGLFDTLYLTRQGQGRLPLSLFGDAINRTADIILKLVNNERRILLIDEIENGIHYSNQRDFWKTLFRLAVEFDTQIFATTHSLEMIQAFADVGLGEYEECSIYQGCGAYFELARHPKLNQIIGIKRQLETINYALEHGKGVRGE